MKNLKVLTLFIGLFFGGWSQSATLYVGVGAQCNAANHYDNLALALLEAAVNGSQNDEIRLTNTVNYIGGADGDNVLTDFNPANRGALTIVGGYANCDSSGSSGFTSIGGTVGAVFDVIGQSEVTLRNLQLTGSQNRGLVVREGSSVFLESTDVSENVAGIRALDGAIVSVDANSSVVSNGDLDDISKGGGIWCFGNSSEIFVSGTISRNQAVSGGNIYIEDGCFAELAGGALVEGFGSFSESSAISGGGIMVHDGGELFANGGANRVSITDHTADFGGGLYVWGTGRATLLNTFIGRNTGFERGSGLYAINGGNTVTQVTMDRAASCPFLISCSELEANNFFDSVVYVNNSKISIQRTLLENNQFFQPDFIARGLLTAENGAVVELGNSAITKNNAQYLVLNNQSTTEISHLTLAANFYRNTSGVEEDAFAWINIGTGSTALRIENSIFQNTIGGDDRSLGRVSGKCNLIGNDNEWPVGSYVMGSAEFINVASGDSRQLSSSDGVDMCQADTFAWSTDRDIEYQVSPVNESTNPQGDPGESGGLYDAGFDEVYDNIGDDEFLLTVQKEGSGEGFVISDPLGISCGSDCTEVVFNGTLVTLSATATGNSEFIGWRSCPLINGSNECLISVTESATVFAEFQPDDLIFSDNFE